MFVLLICTSDLTVWRPSSGIKPTRVKWRPNYGKDNPEQTAANNSIHHTLCLHCQNVCKEHEKLSVITENTTSLWMPPAIGTLGRRDVIASRMALLSMIFFFFCRIPGDPFEIYPVKITLRFPIISGITRNLILCGCPCLQTPRIQGFRLCAECFCRLKYM